MGSKRFGLAPGADEPDVVDNSHNSRPNQDFLKRVYEVVRVCQASSSFALFYWVVTVCWKVR